MGILKKFFKNGRQKLWTIHRDYLREKHELLYLFWECTMNCNFKCKHCGSHAGENFFKEVVATKEIKDAFLDVSKNFDVSKITVAVTGGEPLLRKDLFEVMEYASLLGFKWGMVSNGFLFTEDIVKKLKASGMKTVDISIDGIDDIHDNFRNQKGSYARAINAVRLLQKADFLDVLRITTTVHKSNIHLLKKMFSKFLKMGIKDWRIVGIEPIGRAIENKSALLNQDQYKKLLSFIKQVRKKQSKMRVSYGCTHFLGNNFEDEVRNNFFYCGTGINIGSILHNGDIFVCPNVPRKSNLIQGNIKTDSFSEVWNKKFKIFRKKDRTKCDKCKNCKNWEECLGGSFHSWDFEKKQQKVCFLK